METPGVRPGDVPLIEPEGPATKPTEKAATLEELAKDFALFTPALLYTAVPLMGCDPYATFTASKGLPPGEGLVQWNFRQPLFAGLPGEWAHALFALPRELFDEYIPWLFSAVFRDVRTGHVYVVRDSGVHVMDPKAKKLQAVVALCVESSLGALNVLDVPGSLPQPVAAPAPDVLLRLSASLAAGDMQAASDNIDAMPPKSTPSGLILPDNF